VSAVTVPVFKVVRAHDDGRMGSMGVETWEPAHVWYAPGEMARPAPWALALGFGICCFDDWRAALDFWRCEPDTRQVWEAEAEAPLWEPGWRPCLPGDLDEGYVRTHLVERVAPQGSPYARFPARTRMTGGLRLVRMIRGHNP